MHNNRYGYNPASINLCEPARLCNPTALPAEPLYVLFPDPVMSSFDDVLLIDQLLLVSKTIKLKKLLEQLLAHQVGHESVAVFDPVLGVSKHNRRRFMKHVISHFKTIRQSES